jgi:hypothetical protein
MSLIFNALALLFAVLTAGAYWWGVRESLFWIYPWYDIMLHILGGLVMGSWAIAVVERLGMRSFDALKLILGIVLAGALLWEVFEYIVGFNSGEGYVADTLADITNGLLGALLVSGVYLYVIRRKEAPHEE